MPKRPARPLARHVEQALQTAMQSRLKPNDSENRRAAHVERAISKTLQASFVQPLTAPPTGREVLQGDIVISSSPKSPFSSGDQLKYGDYKSLHKRFGLSVPGWLCIKALASHPHRSTFANWRALVSLVEDVGIVRGHRLEIGTKVYKGGGLNLDTDRSNDWSGCYLAETRSLAEGYGNVVTLTVQRPLILVDVRGRFIASGSIPGDIKATHLKNLMDIPRHNKLIPYLGDRDRGYRGVENEEGDLEIIVAWNILSDYFTW